MLRTNPLPFRFPESIGWSRLAKGYKLLGIVSEIISDDLVIVSLPNMMRGYVMRHNPSHPPLTTSLSLHQATTFYVSSLTKEDKRVELSIEPQLINKGITHDQLCTDATVRVRVSSKEDHGYIVETGIAGVNAFLPFKLVTTTGTHNLAPGQILDAIIHKSSTSSRAITLTLPPPTTATSLLAPSPNLMSPLLSPHTLKSLLPNMLVKCTIEGFARNGLFVTFFNGAFHGCIDHSHLPTLFTNDEWRAHYKDNNVVTVTARITTIESSSRTVRLSLLPHIVEGTRGGALPKVGQVVKFPVVRRVDAKIGVMLSMDESTIEDENMEGRKRKSPSTSTTIPIYVHVAEMVDSDGNDRQTDAAVSKMFKVTGTVPAVRVIGSYVFENVVKGSTKESVLEAKVLGYADLVPGTLYRGVEITSSGDYGILVKLGNNIKAICTNMHLDAKSRAKAYAVGSKIDVRVLDVNAGTKQCSVTALSKMLKGSVDKCLVMDWSVKMNEVATGFVTKVSEKGVIVTFFNKVHCMVTGKALAEELGVEDPRVNYKVGEVLDVRIVRNKNSKLLGSFDLKGVTVESASDSMEVGMVFKKKEFKVTSLEDKFAIVTHVPTGTSCKLPFDSLNDESADSNASAASKLKVGKGVPGDALVLALERKYPNAPVITIRPRLVENPGAIPTDVASLTVTAKVTGYVVNHDDKFGAFIRFCNHCTGIVPRSKGGLDLTLHSTVELVVSGLDLKGKNPKVLLTTDVESNPNKKASGRVALEMESGEQVGRVEVVDVKYERINVKMMESKYKHGRTKCRIHYSLMRNDNSSSSSKKLKKRVDSDDMEIPSSHPFYKIKVGDIIENVSVATTEKVEGGDKGPVLYADLTTMEAGDCVPTDAEGLKIGDKYSGVVYKVVPGKGVMLLIAPGVKGFMSGVEMSTDATDLNNLNKAVKIGERYDVVVTKVRKSEQEGKMASIELSHLRNKSSGKKVAPTAGSVVTARINRKFNSFGNSPAVMMDLMGGFVGQCDITELEDEENWANMPLGRMIKKVGENASEEEKEKAEWELDMTR